MTSPVVHPVVMHRAVIADLSATTLYRLLALRSEVFVVEQDCVYLDLDGRDLEPSTRQLWISSSAPDAVLATCRLTLDTEAWRIGRVATSATARSHGLAAALIRAAIDEARTTGDPSEIVLNGQAHLETWYERLGFVRYGETYDEDGIPHVPMRLSD